MKENNLKILSKLYPFEVRTFGGTVCFRQDMSSILNIAKLKRVYAIVVESNINTRDRGVSIVVPTLVATIS